MAGGLLFELLGQSAGDPLVDEDDIPIVLRSWQAQNFLVTVMHIKGSVSSVNVLGITEVQVVLAWHILSMASRHNLMIYSLHSFKVVVCFDFIVSMLCFD